MNNFSTLPNIPRNDSTVKLDREKSALDLKQDSSSSSEITSCNGDNTVETQIAEPADIMDATSDKKQFKPYKRDKNDKKQIEHNVAWFNGIITTSSSSKDILMYTNFLNDFTFDDKADPELMQQFHVSEVHYGLIHAFHQIQEQNMSNYGRDTVIGCILNATNVPLLAHDFLDENFITTLKNLFKADNLAASLRTYGSMMLVYILGILGNIGRNCPSHKDLLTSDNFTPILLAIVQDKEYGFLNLIAIGVLVYIMHDDEMKQLQDTGSISLCISGLRSALKNSSHMCAISNIEWTVAEFVEVLVGMAANDDNKKIIVQKGALKLLTQMLKENYEKDIEFKEKKASAETIWVLSFNAEVREDIKKEPGCMEALQEHAKQSPDKEVRKRCKGALWNLNESERQHAEHKSRTRSVQHVMISYNHSHQKTLIQIKDKLRQQGHNVWMDVDQMSGSTLEAMAEAVENAYVILMDISEEYKQSPACRLEAEYAYKMKKPIIPLMLQRRYKAEGWLGMLIGTKLYINFDGKFSDEKALQMLLKEMSKYSGVPSAVEEEIIQATHAQPLIGERQMTSRFESYPKLHHKWDKEQLADWLRTFNLTAVAEEYPEADGLFLEGLELCLHEAPEQFYSLLKLDAQTLMRFRAAIKKL